MIDGSIKSNRMLSFELQNSHVIERCSNLTSARTWTTLQSPYRAATIRPLDFININSVGGGDSPIKMTRVSSYLLGLKICRLVRLRVI